MKNIKILFLLILFTSVSSFAQVITFKVDTVTCFEHSSTITTDEAIRTNSYTITGESYPNGTYKFDFDRMVLYYTDKDNLTSECQIIEKEILDPTLKTFTATFITTKTKRFIDIILSMGVDKNDGYVVYLRSNERVLGITTTKGAFKTNVILE